MTIDDAIEIIAECRYCKEKSYDNECLTDCGCFEAKILAIEALEKQIRKRVYLVSDGYADGYPVWEEYCPACESELDGCSYYDFCPYCGQALDWSEEDE